MKNVVTIAGFDPSGGAGIIADIKTFTSMGVFASGVITNNTVQNHSGVLFAVPVAGQLIEQQLTALGADAAPDAIKIGLLGDKASVTAIVKFATSWEAKPALVWDPVLNSGDGQLPLSFVDIDSLNSELLPHVTLATPNIPEAQALTGIEIASAQDIEAVCRKLVSLGATAVLIKGGHAPAGDQVCDTLFAGGNFYYFEHPAIKKPRVHGTGCLLSAAITARIALGDQLPEAVAAGIEFTTQAIEAALCYPKADFMVANPAPEQHFNSENADANLLHLALQSLGKVDFYRLIPEVQSNFVYLPPGATMASQAWGYRGRIGHVGSKIRTFAPPSLGGSAHITRVVLAAVKYYPQLRSAIALRYSDQILTAVKSAGLIVTSFNRDDEPPDVAEREGSSLEWGTETALASHQAASSLIPDIVFDHGGCGKEPVIRLLGTSPDDVVSKTYKILEQI